jgi:hypothetical protein
MEKSTNIFYKIFQIMDHYENTLDKISYNGDKYKPDEPLNKFMNADEFFASIFKNVPAPKKVEKVPPPAEVPLDAPTEAPTETPPEPEIPNEPPAQERETETKTVIKNYIKKCYKLIVLKCHPDKNKDNVTKFLKCHEYYENNFLIGLLYIFYLCKINPPSPLNISSPTVPGDDCSILLDRIVCEIRVIQDKLEQLNSLIQEVEPSAEKSPA